MSGDARMIELLYIAGCPHHEALHPHLTRLMADLGIAAPVHLVEITGDDQARDRSFLGSPSLRVDGVDVDPCAAGRTDFGVQCRLYHGEDGLRGTPPDTWILQALTSRGDGARDHGSR